MVSTALPESKDPEQVHVAVKSFMSACTQAELLELLEKIMLQKTKFVFNKNLQNLLIIAAIKVNLCGNTFAPTDGNVWYAFRLCMLWMKTSFAHPFQAV